jgi:hypothetical protein
MERNSLAGLSDAPAARSPTRCGSSHTAAYWLILIVRDAFLYTLRVWAILFGLPQARSRNIWPQTARTCSFSASTDKRQHRPAIRRPSCCRSAPSPLRQEPGRDRRG